MALNEIYRDADSVPYPVASDIVAGDLVVFASGLVGVAEVNAKANEAGNGYVATIRTKGIWSFSMGVGAVTTGTSIYATVTPSAGVGVKGAITTTVGSNPKIGTVYRGKPSAAGKVYVRIGG